MLPRNVFLHVAKVPSLAALGQRFVLQGGTQRNLAAVKARGRFSARQLSRERRGARDCGSSALRRIGSDWRGVGGDPPVCATGARAASSAWTLCAPSATRPPATRRRAATICKNACLRTFLDVQIGDAATAHHLWPPVKKARRKTCSRCAGFMHRWKPPRPPIRISLNLPRMKSGGRAIQRTLPIRFPREPGLLPPAAGLRSGKARAVAHRHSPRPQPLCLCAALQRLSGKPGRARGKYCLLGCDHERDVSLRLQPRLHRSLLSVEDRHRALSQFALSPARAKAAGRDLLSRCLMCFRQSW